MAILLTNIQTDSSGKVTSVDVKNTDTNTTTTYQPAPINTTTLKKQFAQFTSFELANGDYISFKKAGNGSVSPSGPLSPFQQKDNPETYTFQGLRLTYDPSVVMATFFLIVGDGAGRDPEFRDVIDLSQRVAFKDNPIYKKVPVYYGRLFNSSSPRKWTFEEVHPASVNQAFSFVVLNGTKLTGKIRLSVKRDAGRINFDPNAPTGNLPPTTSASRKDLLKFAMFDLLNNSTPFTSLINPSIGEEYFFTNLANDKVVVEVPFVIQNGIVTMTQYDITKPTLNATTVPNYSTETGTPTTHSFILKTQNLNDGTSLVWLDLLGCNDATQENGSFAFGEIWLSGLEVL